MKWPHAFVLCALLFASCETAGSLVYEPEPDDPLDGFAGSLAEVGINTEMDWGPKQSGLLSEYKLLLERNAHLENETKRLEAENQNLQNQLSGELAELEKQRGKCAQAEAETERLRKAVRERDGMILSLSIEKAKLEQDSLRRQIAELDETLEQLRPTATEAAATPAGRQP